jgi:hypothetical protein
VVDDGTVLCVDTIRCCFPSCRICSCIVLLWFAVHFNAVYRSRDRLLSEQPTVVCWQTCVKDGLLLFVWSLCLVSLMMPDSADKDSRTCDRSLLLPVSRCLFECQK